MDDDEERTYSPSDIIRTPSGDITRSEYESLQDQYPNGIPADAIAELVGGRTDEEREDIEEQRISGITERIREVQGEQAAATYTEMQTERQVREALANYDSLSPREQFNTIIQAQEIGIIQDALIPEGAKYVPGLNIDWSKSGLSREEISRIENSLALKRGVPIEGFGYVTQEQQEKRKEIEETLDDLKDYKERTGYNLQAAFADGKGETVYKARELGIFTNEQVLNAQFGGTKSQTYIGGLEAFDKLIKEGKIPEGSTFIDYNPVDNLIIFNPPVSDKLKSFINPQTGKLQLSEAVRNGIISVSDYKNWNVTQSDINNILNEQKQSEADNKLLADYYTPAKISGLNQHDAGYDIAKALVSGNQEVVDAVYRRFDPESIQDAEKYIDEYWAAKGWQPLGDFTPAVPFTTEFQQGVWDSTPWHEEQGETLNTYIISGAETGVANLINHIADITSEKFPDASQELRNSVIASSLAPIAVMPLSSPTTVKNINWDDVLLDIQRSRAIPLQRLSPANIRNFGGTDFVIPLIIGGAYLYAGQSVVEALRVKENTAPVLPIVEQIASFKQTYGRDPTPDEIVFIRGDGEAKTYTELGKTIPNWDKATVWLIPNKEEISKAIDKAKALVEEHNRVINHSKEPVSPEYSYKNIINGSTGNALDIPFVPDVPAPQPRLPGEALRIPKTTTAEEYWTDIVQQQIEKAKQREYEREIAREADKDKAITERIKELQAEKAEAIKKGDKKRVDEIDAMLAWWQDLLNMLKETLEKERIAEAEKEVEAEANKPEETPRESEYEEYQREMLEQLGEQLRKEKEAEQKRKAKEHEADVFEQEDIYDWIEDEEEPKTTAKPIPIPSTDLEAATETETKTKVLPVVVTLPQTQTQLQTQTQTETETKPTPITQLQTETQTELQTKTATQTEVDTDTGIDVTTITGEGADTTKEVTDITETGRGRGKDLLISQTKDGKIIEVVAPPGSVTWKQGFGYWLRYPSYGNEDRIFLLKKPKGAIVAKNAKSAYDTIQTISGKSPDDLPKMDMGVVDVLIEKPPKSPKANNKRAISFKRDPIVARGRNAIKNKKVGVYFTSGKMVSRHRIGNKRK